MSFKNFWNFAVAYVFFVFVSCGGQKFETSDKLGKLRVLALISDKPEVNEGMTFTVSSLMSFPDYQGQVLEHEAVGCVDPGAFAGAEPTCEKAAVKIPLLARTAVNLSGPHYTQILSGIFSYGIPSGFLSTLSNIEAYNGASFLIDYRVFVSGVLSSRAFKRILVSTRAPADFNTNPVFTDVNAAGVSWTAPVFMNTPVQALWLTSSAQNYPVKTSDGSVVNLKENLRVSWFSSQGRFVRPETNADAENTFLGSEVLHNSYVVVVILRDNRGGQSALVRNL